MTRVRFIAVMALIATNVTLASATDVREDETSSTFTRVATSRAMTEYGKLPLIFEPIGALPGGGTRFISRRGVHAAVVSTRGFQLATRPSAAGVVTVQDFDFIGGSASARSEGVDLQETRIHRLRSSALDGVADVGVPTYRHVHINDAYPRIKIDFYGHGSRLEYDVVVEPGGDPSLFGLRLPGAVLALDDVGDLRVMRDTEVWQLHRPLAYQEIDGRRIDVDSAFVIADNDDVRIRVGAYDHEHSLVIDPVVSYATYIGGNSFEQGMAIAADAAGNAYIAGYTLSSDFPTVSAYDRSLGKNGDVDVFVAKLNAAGTALVWSTYLGGAGSIDRAVGLAVDAAGSAYVTGQTASNVFPVSATAWQKGVVGGGAFVAKLTPTGNALAYSTYVAGATSNAIAVDVDGNAYVTGVATTAFTTTPGALQSGPADAAGSGFVLKLNAAASAPVYSTLLGGSGSDQATAINVDAKGNAYVGGWTTSGDFPRINAFQNTLRGQKDGFVAKLDPTGARLIYSTLLGGVLDDAVNAIAIDNLGYAYVAGETYSSDFPSKGGFQPLKAGAQLINSSVGSAFVAKLAPTGGALVYSSFLGGEVCRTQCQLVFGPLPQYRADAAYGIAVDATGHAFVTGIARSYTFPLADSSAIGKQADNENSAFVSKISASGGALLWSTFVRTGLNESDNGWTRFPPGAATGIALDASGAAYVTGDADSSSNFQPTPGAFQTTNSNGQGATVVKFAAEPTMTLATSNASVDAGTPVVLTATVSSGAVAGDVVFMNGALSIGSAPLAANKATLSITLPVGIYALTAVLHIPGIAADTPTLYQVVDSPLTCN